MFSVCLWAFFHVIYIDCLLIRFYIHLVYVIYNKKNILILIIIKNDIKVFHLNNTTNSCYYRKKIVTMGNINFIFYGGENNHNTLWNENKNTKVL